MFNNSASRVAGLALSLMLVASVASRVQAQDAASLQQQRQEKLEQAQANQQQRQEQREERLEQRCEVLEQNISTRVARFDNNKDRHVTRYNHLIEVAQGAIDRAKSDGKDTAAAESALAQLKTDVSAFATAASAHHDALAQTQQHACGESEGAFKESLTNARQLVLEVRTAASQVRNTYQTKLRPALMALR